MNCLCLHLPSAAAQIIRQKRNHAFPTNANLASGHWVGFLNIGHIRTDAMHCNDFHMRKPYQNVAYSGKCCTEQSFCENFVN